MASRAGWRAWLRVCGERQYRWWWASKSTPLSAPDPSLLTIPCSQTLVTDGYIPVVASVASDGKGQGLNVNADTAAGEVRTPARALVGSWDSAGVGWVGMNADAAVGEASPTRCCHLPTPTPAHCGGAAYGEAHSQD